MEMPSTLLMLSLARFHHQTRNSGILPLSTAIQLGHITPTSVDCDVQSLQLAHVSACRKVKVAGAICKGRKRKTWKEFLDNESAWFTS